MTVQTDKASHSKMPHCAFSLEGVNRLSWKKAQVFDIAPLKLEVEEHLVEEKICPHCCHFCQASLPDGLRFGVQYGHRISALAVYLNTYHYLSSDRVVEFFQDIFNHTLSEGTVFNSQQKCFYSLEQFEEILKGALRNCSEAHADETGLRIQRRNGYLHVFSTNKSSHFSIHRKRGREAMEEIDILPYFKGTLIRPTFLGLRLDFRELFHIYSFQFLTRRSNKFKLRPIKKSIANS